MDISLFDFQLPARCIAQRPASPRDSARLLFFNRQTGTTKDTHISDLLSFLSSGDVLVFNKSKVIPARIRGKKSTGGKAEILLLHQVSANVWQVLLGGKRIVSGTQLVFRNGLSAEIMKKNPDGTGHAKFSCSGKTFFEVLARIGETPIPPYIKTRAARRASQYQTVYADASKSGSAAAPTAGLHFTKRLLAQLREQGIQIEFVTLHVGLGTFAPVKTQDITRHKLHAEFVDVDAQTQQRIFEAKAAGRRIIAVGTTTVRTLESVIPKRRPRAFKNIQSWINPFFYPGYTFVVVDGMLTNFHLPKSSLLMLVAAFAGREHVLRAYRHAIRSGYRFYSFGDAMLIL